MARVEAPTMKARFARYLVGLVLWFFATGWSLEAKPVEPRVAGKFPRLSRIAVEVQRTSIIPSSESAFLIACLNSDEPENQAIASWLVGEAQTVDADLLLIFHRRKTMFRSPLARGFAIVADAKLNVRPSDTKTSLLLRLERQGEPIARTEAGRELALVDEAEAIKYLSRLCSCRGEGAATFAGCYLEALASERARPITTPTLPDESYQDVILVVEGRYLYSRAEISFSSVP